jgi:hypothetical protein
MSEEKMKVDMSIEIEATAGIYSTSISKSGGKEIDTSAAGETIHQQQPQKHRQQLQQQQHQQQEATRTEAEAVETATATTTGTTAATMETTARAAVSA